jgi:hypothetical protein
MKHFAIARKCGSRELCSAEINTCYRHWAAKVPRNCGRRKFVSHPPREISVSIPAVRQMACKTFLRFKCPEEQCQSRPRFGRSQRDLGYHHHQTLDTRAM